MNPWKIIGWIVLAFIVLVLYSCGKAASELSSARSGSGAETASYPAPSAAQPSPPDLTADLISFACEESASGRYTRAEITIRNTSLNPLKFPEAYVAVAGRVETAPFTPFEVPAGSLANASIMSQAKGDCVLQAVQDHSGTPIAITKKG